ncbi:hypothetical protein Hanom_Chr15g01413951 [Helianthus anomalus]
MESVTSIPRQVEVFTLLSTGDWRRPYRYSNLPCKSIYFDGFQVVVDDWLVTDRVSMPVIYVWMMEDGVQKSFTKLYSVHVSAPEASVRGFRKSGEPADDIRGRLVVYEPNSKHIQSLGIDGDVLSFFVYPYVESLLLLVYCLQ